MAATRQQDVLGLDVAMDHTVRVRITQSIGDLAGDLQGIGQRKLWLPLQPLSQRFAFNVRHDIVDHPIRLTGVVQRQKVGMLQLGGKPNLAKKSLGAEDGRYLVTGHLDRDLTIMPAVVRQINLRGSALSQLSDDLVAAQQAARQEPFTRSKVGEQR